MAPTPRALADRAKRELERGALLARNGIKLVTGIDSPQLGQSPKDVVWRAGRCELWRCRSTHASDAPPLLIVFSLISRSYVLDLLPGNSFIEQLVAAGFDVYLLDWGVPDERDAANTLEDYTDGYIPAAVEQVRRRSGSDDVVMLGYCLGGVLALLYAAHHPGSLRGLITMAAPVDFSQLTGFGELLRSNRIHLDTVFDDNGNVPAVIVRELFRLLQPTGELVLYASLLANVWRDDYVATHRAMTQWSYDHIPFPGALASQIAGMLGADNALMTGHAILGGDAVDLRAIECPFLGVLATRDHIIPEPAAAAVVDLVGSRDKQLVRVETGHMGSIVGRTAADRTVPAIVEFLRTHTAPHDATVGGRG